MDMVQMTNGCQERDRVKIDLMVVYEKHLGFESFTHLSFNGLLEYTLSVNPDSWPGSNVVGTIK